MPTASPASAKPTKARTKAARKPARAKTVKASARTRAAGTTTQSKTTRAKAARTRTVHQTEATLRSAQNATRDTAAVVGDYAERAVLIPVGAALVARDRVVSSVSDTLSTYSSSAKAQQQLRRFERRAITARKRLEREVRKARVRVERELRQRRRVIDSTVSDLAGRVPELANRVQERFLSLV